MSDPASLFDVAPFVAAPAEGTIQQRFEAFHQSNPWIYNALVSLARDWKYQGHDRVGIKTLIEVVRWTYGRRTRRATDQKWKLNNSFTSRYARLIAEREPDLAELFETRELRAA